MLVGIQTTEDVSGARLQLFCLVFSKMLSRAVLWWPKSIDTIYWIGRCGNDFVFLLTKLSIL